MQKKLKKILCGFLACGIMASSCSNVAYAQEDEVAVDTTQTAAEETLEPPEEPVEETNSEATPETASATQISVSVVDRSFEESDERIDYALFDVGDVESTMPYGKPVPLYFQIDHPADGSRTEITLDGDAYFVTSSGEETPSATSFVNREYTDTECASWLLFVQADSDFSATITYSTGDTSMSKTATVTMQDVPMLMALPRSSEQYHITGVDKVGGEWLITFEGEYNSYCMDHGLDGKPSSTVYWTYYGTTDLLEKAAQAGCTTKNEIQQYVWDHRDEASDSGSSYVYAASASGWQNVVTTFGHGGETEPTPPPEETPSPTPEPRYGAEWSVNVTENASASFNTSLTVRVNKYANVTHESISDAEITISAANAGENLDGGSWSITPANQVIRTVNGDGSVTFSYDVATTIQFMLRRGNDGKVMVYTRTQPTEPWQPTNSAVLTMVDKPTPPPDEPKPTPDIPNATPTPTPTYYVPQTGDNSNPLVWVVVLITAACGAAYAYWRRKQETK